MSRRLRAPPFQRATYPGRAPVHLRRARVVYVLASARRRVQVVQPRGADDGARRHLQPPCARGERRWRARRGDAAIDAVLHRDSVGDGRRARFFSAFGAQRLRNRHIVRCRHRGVRARRGGEGKRKCGDDERPPPSQSRSCAGESTSVGAWMGETGWQLAPGGRGHSKVSGDLHEVATSSRNPSGREPRIGSRSVEVAMRKKHNSAVARSQSSPRRDCSTRTPMADESSQRTSAESGEGTCTPSGPAAAAGDVAAHVHGHHAGAHHEHHAGDDGALAAARATTAAQHAAALAALAREHARDAAEAAWLAHPDTAARYLVAHNGHWAPAAKGLLATLEWRRTHAAAPLYCAPCAADPGSHAFVPLGVDAAGRGVVYGCHARARNQEATGMVRHVVHSVERVQEVTGVSQWRWVIDFAGFSMRQALQVRMATHAVTTLSTHLPETLHSAVRRGRGGGGAGRACAGRGSSEGSAPASARTALLVRCEDAGRVRVRGRPRQRGARAFEASPPVH